MSEETTSTVAATSTAKAKSKGEAVKCVTKKAVYIGSHYYARGDEVTVTLEKGQELPPYLGRAGETKKVQRTDAAMRVDPIQEALAKRRVREALTDVPGIRAVTK